jgi:putative protease
MKRAPRPVELLSPAKDLVCGMEAVNHGADAVYIGAPKFSARSAAGNSIDDIRRLCDYAHVFGVRIYVALNTLLKEEELKETEHLIRELYEAEVDALIIQDMAITRMDIPPIALHASTQMDNRTAGKVKFLEAEGFSQIVLARELSLNQIRKISEQASVRLEAFIHGAICVSYSGQCYLSAALSGRSANRGECAQYCRLPYTMADAEGNVVMKDKHLLSLKDMNRTDDLEALLDAGISSLKIEGRLKDLSYVKNITAWYRLRLDEILARRTEYCRASEGRSIFNFKPSPEKSFNRGFTPFFLHKRSPDITAFDTPKSIGEPIGSVKKLKGNSLIIAGVKPLHNGDGLAFFNAKGELDGFRVNKVEDGNHVFPQEMPKLLPKTLLYRNFDQEFEKQLAKPSAVRKIGVEMEFVDHPQGFTLYVKDETGTEVSVTETFSPPDPALTNQVEQIKQQLSKLGNTPYEPTSIKVSMSENRFVPHSISTAMRRQAIERLTMHRKAYSRQTREKRSTQSIAPLPLPVRELTYLWNVSNPVSETFYRDHGATRIDPAFELAPQPNVPLMFTRHCLRYSLGWCPTMQKQAHPYKEPFYLIYKQTRLKLQFDCKNCQMLLFADK